MAPTRGPGQGYDGQAEPPQRQEAGSYQQLSYSPQRSHPPVNPISKQIEVSMRAVA